MPWSEQETLPCTFLPSLECVVRGVRAALRVSELDGSIHLHHTAHLQIPNSGVVQPPDRAKRGAARCAPQR